MKKVLVIGGGPAGMIAAIAAARKGHQVSLYEKNDKLGKKLFITGKGRCNITNASDIETLMSQITTNAKFLYSAIYTFSNEATIEFFNELNVKTKVERGNRVFPQSDKSSDVIRGLEEELRRLKVEIHLKAKVTDILVKDNTFTGIRVKDYGQQKGDAVIITTGGLSYPSTGATGDGFVFAKQMGHKITPTSPSLVPIAVKEPWVKNLQGLSLRNVKVKIGTEKQVIYEAFGEMLFTHYGVSGPLILSASRYILPYLNVPIKISIDLKPALDDKALDSRVLKDFDKYQKKQFKNALEDLLPKKLIPVMINLSMISEDKKVAEITKEERADLIHHLKALTLTVDGLRGYNEAIITYGGIDLKGIDPHTMASTLVEGVYFAGEVLDLDALTGGYNLQIAWSTGYLAGISV